MRFTVAPNADTGLDRSSQVMIDKAMTVMRAKIGKTIGCLDANAMVEVERRLAVFLGIAK